MGIPQVFGDAGTSIAGFFLKNRRLQWLPGLIFIASIILCFLAQEKSFPHVKAVKGFAQYIQLYMPLIRDYYVPIINFLIGAFSISIFVLCLLSFLINTLLLPVVNLANLAKRFAEVLLVLIIPNCVLCVSFIIFTLTPAAGINQFLAHYNHLWLLLLLPAQAFSQVNNFWSLFVLPYLYFFLCHMFNSIHSWATGIDSNKEVINASASGGRDTVTLADKNMANRYINERSASINSSMRDQFASNLNEGQTYLHAVAIGQGYESIEEWIENHARDAAIQEVQLIKRENRDLGSSYE
jgi:hypothetical protein